MFLDKYGPLLIFLGGLSLLYLVLYFVSVGRPYGGKFALKFLPTYLLVLLFSFLVFLFAVSLPGQGLFIFFTLSAIVSSILLWLRIIRIRLSKPPSEQILICISPYQIISEHHQVIMGLLSIIMGVLGLLSPELRLVAFPAGLLGVSAVSYIWVFGKAPRFMTTTGIHFPVWVLPWEKIISYKWLRKRGEYRNLQITIRRPLPFFHIGVIRIPEKLTGEVEEVLNQYCPVIQPGVYHPKAQV